MCDYQATPTVHVAVTSAVLRSISSPTTAMRSLIGSFNACASTPCAASFTDCSASRFSSFSSGTTVSLSHFEYSIEFSIPNCDSVFYVPCKDAKMSSILYKQINKKPKATNKVIINYIIPKEFNENHLVFLYVEKVRLK